MVRVLHDDVISKQRPLHRGGVEQGELTAAGCIGPVCAVGRLDVCGGSKETVGGGRRGAGMGGCPVCAVGRLDVCGGRGRGEEQVCGGVRSKRVGVFRYAL